MAQAPENPRTWSEVQEEVQAVREAFNNLEPPPEPEDGYGQAVYAIGHHLERLEGTVEARVRIEMGEE